MSIVRASASSSTQNLGATSSNQKSEGGKRKEKDKKVAHRFKKSLARSERKEAPTLPGRKKAPQEGPFKKLQLPGRKTPQRDPRMMGPQTKKQAPQGPQLPGPKNRNGALRGGSQGLKTQPHQTVRGNSPFLEAGKLKGMLQGQKKPSLRHSKLLGSRGLLPSRLQQQGLSAQTKGRGALTGHSGLLQSRKGHPLRTPPPSPGAPLADRKPGNDKMPSLDLSARVRLQGADKDQAKPRLEEPVGKVEKPEVEEKKFAQEDLKSEAATSVKAAAETFQQIQTKEAQATQRMSQVEMKELIQKVEKMVNSVRLETNAAGQKEMSLTLSSGRLEGVKISVNVGPDGKINASFTADAADARNLLSDNIKELEKSLQAKGLEVNRLDVGSDAAGRQNFAGQHQQQQDQNDSGAAFSGSQDEAAWVQESAGVGPGGMRLRRPAQAGGAPRGPVKVQPKRGEGETENTTYVA